MTSIVGAFSTAIGKLEEVTHADPQWEDWIRPIVHLLRQYVDIERTRTVGQVPLMLFPLAGRDYDTPEAAQWAYNMNEDFRSVDPQRGWVLWNRSDIVRYTGIHEVTICYCGGSRECTFNARIPHH